MIHPCSLSFTWQPPGRKCPPPTGTRQEEESRTRPRSGRTAGRSLYTGSPFESSSFYFWNILCDHHFRQRKNIKAEKRYFHWSWAHAHSDNNKRKINNQTITDDFWLPEVNPSAPRRWEPIVEERVGCGASVAHGEQLLVVVVRFRLHHQARQLHVVTEPGARVSCATREQRNIA